MLEQIKNRKYQLLDEEISKNEEEEMEEEEGDDEENNKITIKILQQEKEIIITNLTINSTILELKEKIQKKNKLNILQQRLIFCGKPLEPNNKILNDFQIKNNTIIHLFPRPLVTNTTTTTNTANITTNTTTTRNNNQITGGGNNSNNQIRNFDIINHSPIHFDPQVGQCIREVRMWSYILIIVSVMTIFSNISYLGSTGHFGQGLFDGILNFFELVIFHSSSFYHLSLPPLTHYSNFNKYILNNIYCF